MKANKKLWSAVYKAYDRVNDDWKAEGKGLDLDTEADNRRLYLHFIHMNKDGTPGDDCCNEVKSYADTAKGLTALLKYLKKLPNKWEDA